MGGRNAHHIDEADPNVSIRNEPISARPEAIEGVVIDRDPKALFFRAADSPQEEEFIKRYEGRRYAEKPYGKNVLIQVCKDSIKVNFVDYLEQLQGEVGLWIPKGPVTAAAFNQESFIVMVAQGINQLGRDYYLTQYQIANNCLSTDCQSFPISKPVTSLCYYSRHELVVGHPDGFSILKFDEIFEEYKVLKSECLEKAICINISTRLELIVIGFENSLGVCGYGSQQMVRLEPFDKKVEQMEVYQRMNYLFVLSTTIKGKRFNISVWSLQKGLRLMEVDLEKHMKISSFMLLPCLKTSGRIYILYVTTTFSKPIEEPNTSILQLSEFCPIPLLLLDPSPISSPLTITNFIKPIGRCDYVYFTFGLLLYGINKIQILPQTEIKNLSILFRNCNRDLELEQVVESAYFNVPNRDHLGLKETIDALISNISSVPGTPDYSRGTTASILPA